MQKSYLLPEGLLCYVVVVAVSHWSVMHWRGSHYMSERLTMMTTSAGGQAGPEQGSELAAALRLFSI